MDQIGEQPCGREHRAIPRYEVPGNASRYHLPPQVGILVINSGVQHSHATGDYKTRRGNASGAAATLGRDRSFATLGEADLPRIGGAGRSAFAPPRPSCGRTEDGRVLAAVAAIRRRETCGS